jgi:beta-phosphoglucomutase-like phosphatase (HAD superfamily)
VRRPEVVILDCDGVLVDSERLIQEVDLEMIRALGRAIGLTPAELLADADALVTHMTDLPAVVAALWPRLPSPPIAARVSTSRRH